MHRWVPNSKVGWSAILGPIVAAVIAGLASDPFDWKLPAVAILTAAIAYLIPAREPIELDTYIFTDSE